MAAPLPAFNPEAYPLLEPEKIPSPRLLVFRGLVEENLARMRSLLEGIAPGSGFRHLRPHVKTCKSSWAIRLQMAAGVDRFKATPNELDLLLSSGATDIFVAYPPLAGTAERIAGALASSRASGRAPARVLAQVAAPEHARALAEAARRHSVEIEFLIDLDVGMARTGVAPERAADLLSAIRSSADLRSLRFAGLHAYDGHNRGTTPEARKAAAGEAMERVALAARSLERLDLRVPLVIAGGSTGFLPDLEWLLRSGIPDRVEGSPGTWIYWDSNYDRLMPGLFRPAALVFARVMDRPGQDRVVLDLGHKRWAIDSGPLESFSLEGLEVLGTSEEHTVLRASGAAGKLRIGDWLLLVPRHVCPTVNLWEDFSMIGPRGEVEIASSPVDGRNR